MLVDVLIFYKPKTVTLLLQKRQRLPHVLQMITRQFGKLLLTMKQILYQYLCLSLECIHLNTLEL